MALGAADGHTDRASSASEKGDHLATQGSIFLEHSLLALKRCGILAWVGGSFFLLGTIQYPLFIGNMYSR